jgi:Ran GTPase-activating protein (RanGAP) involved in mRNA processing and transport
MATSPRWEDWELKILNDAIEDFTFSGGTIGREAMTELMDNINVERDKKGLVERSLASVENKIYNLMKEE